MKRSYNLMEGKLTALNDMNDDIINKIIVDVQALANFKIDTETTKPPNKKKEIKKYKPTTDNTQYYKICDEPEIEKKPKPKNNDT